MTNKLKRFSKVHKIPESYIESLTARAQMQLPFIFYGNIIFFVAFILLGLMATVATFGKFSPFTFVGILSIISSFLFFAASILIRKQQLYKAVWLSTVGILIATCIIVDVTPGSTTSLCYYRSGCFMAVMAICNQVVALNKKQIYAFFVCSVLMAIVGDILYIPVSFGPDASGTISAVAVNFFAVIIANVTILLLYKYNEEIVNAALESQVKVSESLKSITGVIEESKNGLDVGQKLYEETRRVSSSIEQLNTIYTGISSDSDGLFQNTSTIRDSSGQMKTQAVQMKQSVSEQNRSINETSQALTEISSSLSNLSDMAEQRGSNMKEMLATLDSEKKLIRKIVDKVSMVKESSDGIAGFVKTVNEIAQQTGVLAMNAAIEASHAGEKGKGFSVISQEIRKLSEQTTSNAKLIAEKLETNTDVVLTTTGLVNDFDNYISRTTEEMRSTIEMLEQLLSGIQGIDVETEKVMNLLSFVVNKSRDTGVMVDGVVKEIDVQDNSIARIKTFAEELADSVGGMSSQLDEIRTAVAKIEAEAQSNIQVTERITSALTE